MPGQGRKAKLLAVAKKKKKFLFVCGTDKLINEPEMLKQAVGNAILHRKLS